MLEEWMAVWQKRVIDTLKKCKFPSSPVGQASRYILVGSSMFYRPLVCLAAAQTFGADPAVALPVACSLQAIHCASLIVDDLPSFDDSPVRREEPACHIRFGESTAILASYLLLTQADRLMLKTVNQLGSDIYAHLRQETATTLEDMIYGQWEDVSLRPIIDLSVKSKIRAAKTGALYAFSAVAGGLVAGASEDCIRLLRDYGRYLGTAYQVFDDMRDKEDVPGDKLRLKELKRCALEALRELNRPAPLLDNLLEKNVPSA